MRCPLLLLAIVVCVALFVGTLITFTLLRTLSWCTLLLRWVRLLRVSRCAIDCSFSVAVTRCRYCRLLPRSVWLSFIQRCSDTFVAAFSVADCFVPLFTLCYALLVLLFVALRVVTLFIRFLTLLLFSVVGLSFVRCLVPVVALRFVTAFVVRAFRCYCLLLICCCVVVLALPLLAVLLRSLLRYRCCALRSRLDVLRLANVTCCCWCRCSLLF